MPQYTLEGWAKKIESDLETTARAIKIKAFSQAVLNTRVDTGLLAGNWQLSNSAPIRSKTSRKDPGYGAALAEIQGVKGEGTSYLTNNLEYAGIWNERDAIIDGVRAMFQQIVRTNLK